MAAQTHHQSSRNHRARRTLVATGLAAALATTALATTLAETAAAATANGASGVTASRAAVPPTQAPSLAERRQAARVPMSEVVAKAVPAKLPTVRRSLPVSTDASAAKGAAVRVEGTAPLATISRTAVSAVTSSVLGTVWPGAYNANPNRQVGKLYYDTAPGPTVSWNVCSGTAINTTNKSFVLTAGHCVFNSDPDKNGRIDGNGYYYEDFRFCPGFEQTCKLGTWYYRTAGTTSSWYYGVGTARTYDWSDDVAVIVMKPNASGYLVNRVGGQGITFNQPANQMRTAFGYPLSDSRWPTYKFSGLDLIYCQGTDTLSASRTKVWIPCRMTGGASGGPWLSWVSSSWTGYVNSVNSHKPYGGEYMEGPYFDNAELALFNRFSAI